MQAEIIPRSIIIGSLDNSSNTPKPNKSNTYRNLFIGLGIASVALGAIAAFAIANYASQNAPWPALKGTILGKAVIGISIGASAVTGITSIVFLKKHNNKANEPDETDNIDTERRRNQNLRQLQRQQVLDQFCDTLDKLNKKLIDHQHDMNKLLKLDKQLIIEIDLKRPAVIRVEDLDSPDQIYQQWMVDYLSDIEYLLYVKNTKFKTI